MLARGTGRLELLGAQLAALAVSGLLLLVGFIAVCTAALYAMLIAWRGSFAPDHLAAGNGLDRHRDHPPPGAGQHGGLHPAWQRRRRGRALRGFSLGVALSFFPADNFGTVVMMLVGRLTHQDLWP